MPAALRAHESHRVTGKELQLSRRSGLWTRRCVRPHDNSCRRSIVTRSIHIYQVNITWNILRPFSVVINLSLLEISRPFVAIAIADWHLGTKDRNGTLPGLLCESLVAEWIASMSSLSASDPQYWWFEKYRKDSKSFKDSPQCPKSCHELGESYPFRTLAEARCVAEGPWFTIHQSHPKFSSNMLPNLIAHSSKSGKFAVTIPSQHLRPLQCDQYTMLIPATTHPETRQQVRIATTENPYPWLHSTV